MTTAVLLTLFGALSRLLPHPPNAVALGALALYSGARLPRRFAFAVPIAALAVSDFLLDFGSGRPALTLVRAADYAVFAGIVLLGRGLAKAAGPAGLAGLSLAASSAFFLVSNLAVWAGDGLYPPTASGLALCFAAAIPFFWNTAAADLAGTAVLFGLDALVRRKTAWRVAAAALLLALPAAAASAQQPAPVSEDVVVTATSVPEEEKEIGSAVTIITREEIEKSERVPVSELLRSVPGLDVVQSGTPGSVDLDLHARDELDADARPRRRRAHELAVLRGLRLVGHDDGEHRADRDRARSVLGPLRLRRDRRRRPDLHAERGRGLLGACDGRGGKRGPGRRLRLRLGRRGPVPRDGQLPLRRVRRRPRRTPTGGSATRARASKRELSGRSRVAVETGPSTARSATRARSARRARPAGFLREERLALPGTFALSDTNRLDVLVAGVRSKPEYRDLDNFFTTETDAQTFQARVSDTARLGAHSLTGFASWERWKVDDASNFGPNLEGQRTTLWGVGAQDTVTFGAFTVTAGLRFDSHSTYGDHWSPRATVSWLSPDALWKVRVSGGAGFRAPTIGELYYPFGGNPDLKPERSVSWELGAERYVGGGRVEVSLFWNELKDLIVYDFVNNRNFNVGRARTRGVEVGWRQPIVSALSVEATYTYLKAENLETGAPLIRRPENRASIAIDWRPVDGLDLIPRLTYVGTRADGDPLTGAPVEDPSYVRLDILARWQAAPLARPLRAREQRPRSPLR